jgi:hypothetical protein
MEHDPTMGRLGILQQYQPREADLEDIGSVMR